MTEAETILTQNPPKASPILFALFKYLIIELKALPYVISAVYLQKTSAWTDKAKVAKNCKVTPKPAQ